MFQKKIPLPSEKTDTESKSKFSTTETSDEGSGRENESQRKCYQWLKNITHGKECLEKSQIRGSANLYCSVAEIIS